MWLLRSLLVRGYTSVCHRYANMFILILAEPPSKKRKLDYRAPEFKDVNTAPSKFSKPSTFRKIMMQHGREVYIHNRPINFDSVPLTLISPIFGRVSDDIFTNHEDLLSRDFAPARDLANLLSELEKDEAARKEPFWDWMLKLLPDIEREESSHDTSLRPHEVRANLTTAIIKGPRRDKKEDFETDGHVELGDNLLLLVEAKPEIGEEPSSPHWQAMAYVRAYYMQERCRYRVGQSPLPAILITFYGMFIPLASMPTC
jgi:hypothetical protein